MEKSLKTKTLAKSKKVVRARRPKASRPIDPQTYPDAITAWLEDGREEDRLSTQASRVAIWAMRLKSARAKNTLSPEIEAKWTGGDQMMVDAAVAGDANFFRKLAAALDGIKDKGCVLDGNDNLVSALRSQKTFVLKNWERWEQAKSKVEVRLAEMKEGGLKISRSQYFLFAKFLGKHFSQGAKKSKSPKSG